MIAIRVGREQSECCAGYRSRLRITECNDGYSGRLFMEHCNLNKSRK